MAHTLFVPLMLTLGAGLATGIGSTIALFAHRTNKRLLSFSLGLSGGVMIYVSFVELFQQAREAIGAIYGPQTGMGITTLAFFGGVLLIGVIDRLVPSVENPHEAHMIEELEKKPKNAKLMRMGLMTALAIGIHNFPEGIATFATAVENPTLGIAIAVAIAIHNGNKEAAVPADTTLISESLDKCLPHNNAQILNAVVTVNLQVTLHIQIHIKSAMYTESLHHMVKKTHFAGSHVTAGAVQIPSKPDVCLFCLSCNLSDSQSASSFPVTVRVLNSYPFIFNSTDHPARG